MAKAVWPSILVLMLVVAVTTAHGLDVLKTRQDELEALVVRDGAVAPSFSIKSSLLSPDYMPWPFLSSLFSPFPRLYEEHTAQSHFLVRHHSPVEVTNFGVVDGLGQISRTDPSLRVSATFKSYRGANTEAVREKDEGGWYVYHLDMDYECNEADPVKRLVVVQLREQAGDTSSDEQLVEKAPEVSFMFSKQCPLPQPGREAEEWPITALFTTWSDGLRGGSLLIASSSSLGAERIDDRFRRPTLMVMVDDAQQQHEGYGHARAPAEERHRHQRPDETERSFFNMPMWLSDALVVMGMASIAIAAVMMVVDVLKALVRGGEDDSEAEDGADGEEVVPLLAHAERDSTDPTEQQPQHQRIEAEKLAEEAVKPNPEVLANCTQEAPKPAEQLQQTEES